MSEEQPNNPLHGITLEAILQKLVDYYGWESLGRRISINSFNLDPSLKSSLTFLRRTPWAREKVERLYLRTNFSVPPKVRRAGAAKPDHGPKKASAAGRGRAPKQARKASKVPEKSSPSLPPDTPGLKTSLPGTQDTGTS